MARDEFGFGHFSLCLLLLSVLLPSLYVAISTYPFSKFLSPHAMDENFKDSVIIVLSIIGIIFITLSTIFFQLWIAYRLEFRRWSAQKKAITAHGQSCPTCGSC